jgi:arylformamidase
MPTASSRNPDFVIQYLTGQLRDAYDALLASFDKASEECVAQLSPQLDIRYGSASRQTVDVFPARDGCLGTVLYFHVGYWQSREKSSRFLARSFVESRLFAGRQSILSAGFI